MLSIKDFRGIRKMDIDLSADLVLLHGRNGTGKTALFDALEWALLGEVEHLGDSSAEGGSRTPFVNIFSEDGTAKVSLQLLTADGTVTLERSTGLTQKEVLRYAGKSFGDDRYALIEILGEQARNLNVVSLRDLIRSSNFLAQTTLRRFFSKTPVERYAAVSHLLGTHDYAKFLTKLSDVRSEFATQRTGTEAKAAVTENTLTAKSADLARLNAQLVDSPAGAELDSRLEETLRVIAATLTDFHSEISVISINQPFLFEEIQAFLDVAEEWRRVNVNAIETQLQHLALIERSEQLLGEQEQQTRSIRTELIRLDSTYDNLTADLRQQEAKRRPLEDTISSLSNEVQMMSSTVTLLQNLATTVEREGQLSIVAAASRQRDADLSRLEDEQRAEREQLQSKIDVLFATTKRISTERESLNQQLQLLATLKGRVSEVPRYRKDIERIQAEVAASESLDASKQSELDSTNQTYANVFSAIQGSDKALESAKSTVQQYRDLLSSFRAYVHNRSCPLCGQDYESPEQLGHRIDQSLKGEPPELKRLETELQTLRQRLKVIISSQDQLRGEIARSASVIRTGRSRLNEITRELTELENLGSSLQLGNEFGNAIAIDKRIRDCESRLRALGQELAQTESEYARQRGEQSRLDSQLRYVSDERQAAGSILNRELGDLSNLAASKATLMKSVALSDSHGLPERIDGASEHVSRVAKRLAGYEQDRAMIDGRIRSIQAELSSILKQKVDKEEQLQTLSLSMDQLKARTAAFEQHNATSLKSERENATLLFSRLRELEAEIARARKQASWLLARREASAIAGEIAALTRDREELRESSQQDLKWEQHLEELGRAIAKARHEAENWQLAHYGPSISNLYKRFSAHPIFGKIEVAVDPVNEEIRITADVSEFVSPYLKHPPGKLAPLQYFCEAQANVLALSVFLSNAFQQRWSKLNSVFMDDPVQNMDDLNSNAFIDTLRALTTTAGRQFVVATCDLQLYKLMLVKLTCLNVSSTKRFSAYRFDGMAVEGPRLIKDI
jgi:DNA repair exonuclease SbcCD ATPase subunit